MSSLSCLVNPIDLPQFNDVLKTVSRMRADVFAPDSVCTHAGLFVSFSLHIVFVTGRARLS